MRGTPVSEKYRGIKSDGITHRKLVKYRCIRSGGFDGQYTVFNMTQFTWLRAYFCAVNLLR